MLTFNTLKDGFRVNEHSFPESIHNEILFFFPILIRVAVASAGSHSNRRTF